MAEEAAPEGAAQVGEKRSRGCHVMSCGVVVCWNFRGGTAGSGLEVRAMRKRPDAVEGSGAPISVLTYHRGIRHFRVRGKCQISGDGTSNDREFAARFWIVTELWTYKGGLGFFNEGRQQQRPVTAAATATATSTATIYGLRLQRQGDVRRLPEANTN